MRIITIASQKGGSGKTTLATHLAVQAEKTGAGPVGVIDTDPQGTLADWRNTRPGITPRFAKTGPQNLVRTVDAMRGAGVRVLFIDTPPALGATIGRAVKLADLVVIPTRPSPNDLRAIGATVALVEGLGKPLVFVINGATPRARITAEAAVALSQHGPVTTTIVHQRVSYAAAMIDGRTAMELAAGARPEKEIAEVWGYLRKRLTRVAAPKSLAVKTKPRGTAASGERQPVAAKSSNKPAVARKRKKPGAAKPEKSSPRRRRKISAPLRTAA